MNSLSRKRSLSLALALGLALTLGLSGAATAHVIIATHGVTGDWGTHDSSETPEGKCGYSAANGSGDAFFRWMKVIPPLALARDLTAGRDSQKVKWQFKIQRSNNLGPWKNMASSAVQTKTAYDDTPAGFTPMKVYFNGTSFSQRMRALIIVTWVRNGSAEGWIKIVPEFYSVKWTVGDPDYVYSDWCDGSAD